MLGAWAICLAGVATVAADGQTYDIRDYGAVGDGITVNTAAINRAIQAAHQASQPGIANYVLVDNGTYLSGQIVLLSDVFLTLTASGTLLASNVTEDYPPQPDNWVFVFSNASSNVGIIGQGKIDGQQPLYVIGYNSANDEFVPRTWTGPPYNCTGECRPRLVQFRHCSYVTVREVTLTHSPDWTFHLQNSSHVHVDGLTQFGDYRWPNNDGVDVDSCHNVTIINSVINTGDDGLCLKSTQGFQDLSRIYARNLTIRSRSSAIKFGSNTDVDCFDLWFENITIWDSNRGLGIQQRTTGGNIWNVTYKDITIQTRQQPLNWWGSGEPIWVTSMPRSIGDNVGVISNITFVNVNATSENTAFISGRPPGNVVRNVTLRDVRIFIGKWGNYTHPDHDYTPTIFVLPERVTSPVQGLYLEWVEGATLDGVAVSYNASDIQPYWSSECINTTSAQYPVNESRISCNPPARG